MRVNLDQRQRFQPVGRQIIPRGLKPLAKVVANPTWPHGAGRMGGTVPSAVGARNGVIRFTPSRDRGVGQRHIHRHHGGADPTASLRRLDERPRTGGILRSQPVAIGRIRRCNSQQAPFPPFCLRQCHAARLPRCPRGVDAENRRAAHTGGSVGAECSSVTAASELERPHPAASNASCRQRSSASSSSAGSYRRSMSWFNLISK